MYYKYKQQAKKDDGNEKNHVELNEKVPDNVEITRF